MADVGAVDTMRFGELGVVVLAGDGSVQSANDCARLLLNAPSPDRLAERLDAIRRQLPNEQFDDGPSHDTCVNTPEVGRLGISSYSLGRNGEGRVVLMRHERSVTATEEILRQASSHRCLTSLSRDWAHDIKGMLHIIKINHALLARVLQRDADGTLSTKSLEAIPREVERIDRALDLALGTRKDDQESNFDMAALCDRVLGMIAARAARQRVEVVYERSPQPVEAHGFESRVQAALLNLLVNALESMPDQGRLVVSVTGGPTARVRICDSGRDMPEVDEMWQPHFVSDPRGTAIGLHVTRTIIEAHGGRIECSANAPRGTCFLVDLPAAPTGRSGNGPRTYR